MDYEMTSISSVQSCRDYHGNNIAKKKWRRVFAGLNFVSGQFRNSLFFFLSGRGGSDNWLDQIIPPLPKNYAQSLLKMKFRGAWMKSPRL